MEKEGYGQRLKVLRKHIGATQQQLAEKLNFEWYKIKDIEAEKLKLSADIASKIEDIYSISGWWLLTGKGEMIKTKSFENTESAKEDKSEDRNRNGDIKVKKKKDSSFEEIEEALEKLPKERQKYYYFKIIAESLEEESKKNKETLITSEY